MRAGDVAGGPRHDDPAGDGDGAIAGGAVTAGAVGARPETGAVVAVAGDQQLAGLFRTLGDADRVDGVLWTGDEIAELLDVRAGRVRPYPEAVARRSLTDRS